MDETTTNTEAETTTTESPKEETPNSVQAPIINPILSEAKEYAERIEQGIKKFEEIYNKNTNLAAEVALGGRSLAGNQAAPKTDEQKLKDEVAKFIADE